MEGRLETVRDDVRSIVAKKAAERDSAKCPGDEQQSRTHEEMRGGRVTVDRLVATCQAAACCSRVTSRPGGTSGGAAVRGCNVHQLCLFAHRRKERACEPFFPFSVVFRVKLPLIILRDSTRSSLPSIGPPQPSKLPPASETARADRRYESS